MADGSAATGEVKAFADNYESERSANNFEATEVSTEAEGEKNMKISHEEDKDKIINQKSEPSLGENLDAVADNMKSLSLDNLVTIYKSVRGSKVVTR